MTTAKIGIIGGSGLYQMPELKDVDMLAQIFMSGMHGIVSLHISRGKDPWVKWRPVRKRAELMIEAMIRGLTRKDEEVRSKNESASEKDDEEAQS